MTEMDKCISVWGLCFSPKIDLGLILTVALFALGFIVNSKLDAKKAKRVRRQYLVALKEEISLIVSLLEKSVREFPDIKQFSALMREENEGKCLNKRPLLTFSYPYFVFRSRTEVLQDLPDTLIKNIVDFYGKLDQIAVDVAGINYPAFIEVSLDGREAFIADINVQERVVLQQGKVILDSITLHIRDVFEQKAGA